MDKISPQRAMFSVSELTSRARNLLEFELANIWVVGEIASISRPASGHWYFNLKDDKAQVRCVMFRQQSLQTRTPAQGDSVLVCGRVSLYEARGDFQLIVAVLEHRGAGALHLQFEKLKAKLQVEDLFNPDLKRKLPRYPHTIGMVTSATGAALQDMLSVVQRHRAPVNILLYPCSVQGETAAAEIRAALQLANRQGSADILIVGRGGGSYEDLFCFNDEALARDIRASTIPVISAVGHEVDFTIADFVADLRAPTPTAAMELALRSLSELPAQLRSEERHLAAAALSLVQQNRHRITSLQRRLRNPGMQIDQYRQGFDRMLIRLYRGLQNTARHRANRLTELGQRLQLASPSRQTLLLQRSVTSLKISLDKQMRQHLRTAQLKLTHQVGVLESVSPMATVLRGYAIVRGNKGEVVRSIDQVDTGDRVSARLRDGDLHLAVTGKSSLP